MLDWIRRSADRLAESPVAFHWLRKLPEWNFRETKRRIAAVRDALGRPRVLDCGCGTAEFASLFPPELYLGVDVHPGYVAAARSRHPRHRLEVADLLTTPGAERAFELELVNCSSSRTYTRTSRARSRASSTGSTTGTTSATPRAGTSSCPACSRSCAPRPTPAAGVPTT